MATDAEALDERCAEAYHIQVHGLMQRLRATGIDKTVIGVSAILSWRKTLWATRKRWVSRISS